MLRFRATYGLRHGVLALVAAAVPIGLALPATAQPVVQPMRPEASERLNDALHRLSRNPESLPALIDAGRASLELDDIDAAQGFFLRAQGVEADNGSVLAGLAIVALRREDPATALDLFERAGEAGENLDTYASDRGLAHDLLGDNARAQAFYGLALSRRENAETVRRLALSYAIAGDQAASEATLLPLLQRRDLAAYRTRAFALAILGREDEAVSIAETMLPATLARRMAPYLRYMPRLTRSQQAAAANLGTFPRAAEIGRDDPQLARRATRTNRPSPSGSADARLIPGGAPLGQPSGELPAIDGDANADDVPAAEGPIVVAALNEEREAPAPAPAPAEAPRPSFSISGSEPAPEESEGSLADAFADFSLAADDAPATAAPGAVDITAIEPVREEPPPPPPPAHPARHWVQVATGQNTGAFRFDWRRIASGAGGLLDDMEPFRVRWNRTNRLVTGPFDSAREAQEFVTALGREGVDAFRFTSAEGEEVVAIN